MKMKNTIIIFIYILILTNIVFGQRGNRQFNGQMGKKIIGKVIDSNSQIPIEYANLVLLKAADSTQVTGAITNTEGFFTLEGIRPGNFLLKISFIGYDPVYIDNISITRESNVLDIGEIALSQTAYEIEEATVIANKSPVEYHIDKKVINVSGQSTSISGSAVEILENVPSVNVDIEGNVSLRGSGSFTLLIDGRPTILDPNDALQQIPASTIENIEIVTNPSAKFDPEGVSGIINVIMKKSEYVGISGIINLNTGLDEKYGGDILASYKTNGYSFYLGGDYRDHNYPGSGEERRITFYDGYNSYLNSDNTNTRSRYGYNFTGGADFVFNEKNSLSLSLRYGDRNGASNSDVNYYEYSVPANGEERYFNISERERGGERFSSSLNYKYKFDQEGHEILTDLDYRFSNGEEFTINEYYDNNDILLSGRKNTEDGPSKRIRAKIDYTLPLNEKSRLEAGVQTEIGRSEDDTKSYLIDGVSGNYLLQDDFSYLVEYDRNIYSAYSIFNSKINRFGYQLGLRAEYTDRVVRLPETNEQSNIQRWDYFPTFHTSYKFNELVQLMASYTRRINRPRGYYLEPFLTWEDQNNVRTGNPDLEPEYINSFEIGYQTHIDEVILSLETYYRESTNKIERIRSVYDTTVTITSVENVGKDYTTGAEFMVDAELFNFWDLNFMGDLSNYKVEGNYLGTDFSRDNFNWSLRVNNSFNLSSSSRIQFNGRYRGPSISAQGEYEGYFSADLAYKQDFWAKKIVMTLQVRDIFQTSRREGTTYGDGFETYTLWERKSPVVMLNISINLNNFKQKRDRDMSNGGDDMDEEF